MNNKVIYLASSSLSIFLANEHRLQYHASCQSTLLIDRSSFHQFNHRKMMGLAESYDWEKIVDCSKITSDTKPTNVKRITRYLKTKPIIKNIYQLFLKLYLKNLNDDQLTIFNEKGLPEKVDYVYTLFNRDINNSISEYVDCDEIRYYEHGVGDYHNWIADRTDRKFYCVLHELLLKITPDNKQNLVHEIKLNRFPKLQIDGTTYTRKSIMLWILQPFEIYNVSKQFWIAYAEEMLKIMQENNLKNLLVKAHPGQSESTIAIVNQYLEGKGINLVYTENKEVQYAPAEFVLSSLEKEISVVATLFSSSIFYMSNLAIFDHIKFYYSFEFFAPYALKGPKQFSKHFVDMRQCFDGNFTNNLIDFHQSSTMPRTS